MEGATAVEAGVKVAGKEIITAANSERQQKEIRGLSTAIVAQNATRVKNELPSDSKENRENALKQHDGILGFAALQRVPNGTVGKFDFSGNLPEVSGVNVISVKEKRGDTLVCTVEGQTDPQEIPRQALEDAYLLSEATSILNDIQDENQRKIVERHINVLKGVDGAVPQEGTPESAAVNQEIEAVADSMEMLTVSDLGVLVDKRFPAAKESGQGADALTAEERPQYEAAMAALNGKNLVDLETMRAVFEGLGYKGDFFDPNGRLARYFQDIEQGNIDPESAKNFIEVVRSGNADDIKRLLPESDEARQERERQEARAKMSSEDQLIERELKNLGGEEGVPGEIEKMKGRIKELQESVNKKATTDEEKKQLAEDQQELYRLKKDLPRYEELQGFLNVVKDEFNGEGAYVFKVIALRQLADVKGLDNVPDLEATLMIAGRKLPAELKKFEDFALASGGFSREEINDIRMRGIDAISDMMKNGKAINDKNLSHFIFGREVDKEELTGIMGKAGLTPEQKSFLDKHGDKIKTSLLLLLLFALKGLTTAATDLATKPQG